jgi:hypothetical protein
MEPLSQQLLLILTSEILTMPSSKEGPTNEFA